MRLTRILKEGMAGADVKHLHVRLVELKYASFRPTGNFGPLTLKAVKKFQSDSGLKVDGIVGNKTWYQLFKNDAKVSSKPVTTDVKPKKSSFNYKPAFVTSTGLEIYDEILPNEEYIKSETKKQFIYAIQQVVRDQIGPSRVGVEMIKMENHIESQQLIQ